MPRGEGSGALRVAVLGAGPIGLDAALAGLERAHRVDVYEAGKRPASNVWDWGHVRLFSPWSMNISNRMRQHMERVGIAFGVDEGAFPTGRQLVEELLDPLWKHAVPLPSLHLGSRVISVAREGVLKHEEIGDPERANRPFRILFEDSDGMERIARADVVLDCTGKYGNPNSLGDGGIPALGERVYSQELIRRIPDIENEAELWAGRVTLLLGSGHSAQTAVTKLAELSTHAPDTRVIWAIRGQVSDWPVIHRDPLSGRNELVEAAVGFALGASPAVELRTGVVLEELYRAEGRMGARLRGLHGDVEDLGADTVLGLVGGVGDHRLYRQLQVHECYATSGPMKLAAALLGSSSADCLDQESHGIDSLRNPEPNFFLLGDKSYGRNNTFLLKNGWQQVDDVFQELSETS